MGILDIKGKTSRTFRERGLRLGLGLGILSLFFALYMVQPTLLQQADRNIYDIFLRAHGGGTPSPAPALIDIDDASLAAVGQWPWPRHVVAKLVDNLTEAGAAAIGLDIIFSEPDNTSLTHVQKSFEQHYNIPLPLQGIPAHMYDNDSILAASIAQSPVVLGSFTQFKGKVSPLPQDMPPPDGVWMNNPPNSLPATSFIPKGQGVTLPLAALRAKAPLASLNAEPDPDGISRSVPLLTQVDDRIFLSLSVRTLMRAMGLQSIGLNSGPLGLSSLKMGTYTIPVNPNGYFMIPFRGPRHYYPTFSAVDILQKKIPVEKLQHRVFIVGTSAPGLLDIRPTPFDAIYSGAEIHATVIDAILSQRFIQIPPSHAKIQKTAMVSVGIVGALIFAMVAASAYMPVLVALTCLILFGTWDAFNDGIYLSPLYVLLIIFSQAVLLLAVRFWQEAKQKRTLRTAFTRYIAPHMVERIVEKGEAVLAGEERTVTLLFTDIRGFTSLSERLKPHEVVHALNRYFTPITAIIHANEGTVDKFIGDSVMAFWNAPLPVQQHPLRAVNSALAMQNALAELNITLQKELDISFSTGIGIHTGKVFVGNMGSAELLDYTCIGDSVNITARLESLCAVYGVPILTSAETAQLCQSYAQEKNAPLAESVPYFLPLDAIRVKGKQQPVEICLPLAQSHKASMEEELQQFLEGRQHYVSGYFQKAHDIFQHLHEAFPHTLLYKVYTQRSALLLAAPPQQWDGVWSYTEKN